MSRFPKLTETFILYEIETLETLGVAVEVYPLLRERQRVTHPEADRWVRRAHYHPFLSLPILRAQTHFLRRDAVGYFRLWMEVLRRTWGSMNFVLGAVGIFPKAVRFAYEMERQGVDHVHAHFASHPAVAAFIIHHLTGIPFSYTAHGSDLHVERRMLEAKVGAAAFVVAISAYNKRIIIAECGEAAREKVHVIHCGVDPDAFVPRPPKACGGPFRIICVASLEEVKGHRFLIEACRILREQGVDFACDLVGEGPLRREIERRITRAALTNHIRVLGGKPRPEVIRLLAEADAAVLASHPTKRGKREGIPVVLMEAMASGLPVVASAISGIPELVESGCTGFLVPPGNPAALADALRGLARDTRLRRRMGNAGRAKVLSEFDLQGNTLELLRLFLRGRRSTEPQPATTGAALGPASPRRD